MIRILKSIFIFVFVACLNTGLAFAQTTELPIEVNLMKAVIIDMEMDFDVSFNKNSKDIVSVGPAISQSNELRPAVVRVRGGGAEALIDLETNNIKIDSDSGETSVEVYDFDIVNKGAGASAIVMPDSNEDSFLLSIGGKIEGFSKNEFFSSVNIININYL